MKLFVARVRHGLSFIDVTVAVAKEEDLDKLVIREHGGDTLFRPYSRRYIGEAAPDITKEGIIRTS